MSQDLVTFLHARLDEEADLARRCDVGQAAALLTQQTEPE